jgi:hypothetical protein
MFDDEEDIDEPSPDFAARGARSSCSGARTRRKEKNYEEAVELYRRSIETYPTAEAHTFLGWVYSFDGRYTEAIDECLEGHPRGLELRQPLQRHRQLPHRAGRLLDLRALVPPRARRAALRSARLPALQPRPRLRAAQPPPRRRAPLRPRARRASPTSRRPPRPSAACRRDSTDRRRTSLSQKFCCRAQARLHILLSAAAASVGGTHKQVANEPFHRRLFPRRTFTRTSRGAGTTHGA